jgi:hypothetical protein
MKYTIFGQYHERIETVKFSTLKELAQYLANEYTDPGITLEELCCVEDADGWGYNAVDLVEEQLKEAVA